VKATGYGIDDLDSKPGRSKGFYLPNHAQAATHTSSYSKGKRNFCCWNKATAAWSWKIYLVSNYHVVN